MPVQMDRINPKQVIVQEETAPSGSAGQDILYADATAHRLKMNNNNAGADVVVGANTTDTLANKTLTAPVSDKLTLTTAAPTVSAGQVGLGSTHATTVGAAGGATALPATPLGYLIMNVDGTQVKVPYYNN